VSGCWWSLPMMYCCFSVRLSSKRSLSNFKFRLSASRSRLATFFSPFGNGAHTIK
jgi:hypothetical protein